LSTYAFDCEDKKEPFLAVAMVTNLLSELPRQIWAPSSLLTKSCKEFASICCGEAEKDVSGSLWPWMKTSQLKSVWTTMECVITGDWLEEPGLLEILHN
jgi:hypothetical protein